MRLCKRTQVPDYGSPEAAVLTNETLLYKELFKDYSKYSHPVINASAAVKVILDFQLISIIDVVSARSLYEFRFSDWLICTT